MITYPDFVVEAFQEMYADKLYRNYGAYLVHRYNGKDKVVCPDCNGTGRKQLYINVTAFCSLCSGKGKATPQVIARAYADRLLNRSLYASRN